MSDPTVIAIDWSGAKKPTGIWVASVRDGELVDSRPLPSRDAAIGAVVEHPGSVVAGFDFSFSVPAWFARENGCRTMDDVWRLAERDGETWLQPTPPFWKDKCTLSADLRFRECERRFPSAKSVFQLVGVGQVGVGSVRGMPLLLRLREQGFGVWPLDASRERLACEIYPSALRKLVSIDREFGTDDERDAVCSAFAMWKYRAEFAALAATDDIEGDIWFPTNLRT